MEWKKTLLHQGGPSMVYVDVNLDYIWHKLSSY